MTSKSVFFQMKYYLYEEKKYHNFKFDDQMAALENLGYDVWFLGITKSDVYLCNGENRRKIKVIPFNKIIILQKLFSYLSIYKSTSKVLKIKSDFDFAYIRSMGSTPSFVKALRNLKKKNVVTVVEIPTHPHNRETNTDKRVFRKVLFNIMRCFDKFASKYVDMYTVIGQHENELHGKPAINIENGIDINRVPLRKSILFNNELHVLALARVARWHGYDRFVEGLRIYNQNEHKVKVVLHIVGNDGDGALRRIKMLCDEYNLSDYVIIEGTAFEQRLDQIIDKCHVALAILGLYRKEMCKCSSIKVAEYCARGIPFINATNNALITEDLKFCLHVPNDDSPIDLYKTVNFAKVLDSNDNISNEMRRYAENNMTWGQQYHKVLRKLESLKLLNNLQDTHRSL